MARDLRQYARQTNTRLAIGFIFLLLVVGDGLIYIIYGRYAAITGLICILSGFVPILLIFIVLWVVDRLVKVNRPD